MWLSNSKESSVFKRTTENGLVAIAIDKDKGSQYALRWTVDNLLLKGQTVILIHVVHKSSSTPVGSAYAIHDGNGAMSAHKQQLEKQTTDLFLTFHCYCTRKDVGFWNGVSSYLMNPLDKIQCLDIILEDSNITKAITEYTTHAAIEHLVLGSSRHGFIKRLKTLDIPTGVLKGAPDFCTIYVISKTKLSSVRNASRIAPFTSPLYYQIHQMQQKSDQPNNDRSLDKQPKHTYSVRDADQTPRRPQSTRDDGDTIRSPFAGVRHLNERLLGELTESESDISFISSNRPSDDRMSTSMYDGIDLCGTSRVSTSSNSSFGSERLGSKESEMSFANEFSSSSLETDDAEAEMRRLKLELRKTLELYSTACKEALTAKQKASELHRWRIDEEQKLKEARLAEEAALKVAENEKAKCGVAIETAEAAERIAKLESQKRVNAEMTTLKEIEEKHKVSNTSGYDLRYRRYTIEEIEEATQFFSESHKIGEGGYGPVFKCCLDHTTVAVKVLRPDATQGRSQFQQEVEVLSCLRHPNMVLLLGACPEYGCLVYEYMANGSLEDRLFRRGNSRTLSWELRFRIASEIAIGLLFFHRTKPEPIVHRDLKPGNILLDNNFVSKISDVGLARLVPPSIADDVTQYRMTSAAGTFCYIDPEYQQTGMLGVKSDVYSLGIILLQLLTAKQAMGLTHHVQQSIEDGTFAEILDPSVTDWPVEEALSIARIGLQCAELRRKDRPDLGNVVLPELNRLREIADKSLTEHFFRTLVV